MEKETKKMKTKEPKAPKPAKEPKAPKAKKAKNQMREGYIGRPKPMKTNKFEFKKPTVGFWIGLGIFILLAGFITYIVIRLVMVSKVTDAFIKAYEYKADEDNPSYVLENDDLRLDFDRATTQFSITQKDTGHVWYSNPQNLDSDQIALQKEKNSMMSTLLVKYSTENGVENIYDSYTYSIKRNFFETEKTAPNEITVKYTVSQMEREYKYPLAIYESDMDEYLDQMTDSDKNVITRRCYRLVDLEKLRESDNEAELIRKYPGLEEDNLYLIFDPLNTYLKENCEKIFAKIGYTDEAYLEHHELYKEKNDKVDPAFNITVKYRLEGDKFVVDVPFDDILYRHAYPVVELTVLPFFGASTLTDEGFMFVPEGGGSIINFNNGKTKQNGYYADVYGWDWARDRNAVIKETRIAYPVYGVSFGDSSFISMLEDGAEYASISAEISGKLASYNYVRSTYRMVHGEQFEVSSRTTSAQYSYEESLPAGEHIRQVYKFVDSPSYVDMAKAYRDYLFDGKQQLNNDSTPLAVEIVGAVDKVQQVAGMPKTLPYKLTSYKDASKIINQIEEAGIENANIKLSGFINGGIREKFMNKFKLISQLGSASDFKKIVNSTKDTSTKLYLDSLTQFAYRSGLTDGFNRYRDPARFASDEVCELSEYSPVWYGKLDTQDTYYLLNPKNINRATDIFIKNAKKYGFDGVSFRDSGYELSADYNDNGVTSREAAKLSQIEKMDEANEAGLGVMINSGNDYALDNVDFITNMTMHGNSYAIIDYQVPFYQIALHGYKNYAGTAVNLGFENNQIVLEAAEAGAGLYFTFMQASEEAIQETNYTEYFAANFDAWKDKFVETYKEYDKAMSPVKNSLIDDYEYLDDSVTVTTYDNGYKVFVNFGYVDYTTDSGKLIPARKYIVEKVED